VLLRERDLFVWGVMHWWRRSHQRRLPILRLLRHSHWLGRWLPRIDVMPAELVWKAVLRSVTGLKV
jgi:hypothetical protein